MQFLEVSFGMAVGTFLGLVGAGLFIRLGKKSEVDNLAKSSLEALSRRNELTEQTNQVLWEVVNELRIARQNRP